MGKMTSMNALVPADSDVISRRADDAARQWIACNLIWDETISNLTPDQRLIYDNGPISLAIH